jgi:hypothetical protein
MILLAYIDTRPFLFVIGLPLFIGLALLGCWLTGRPFGKGKVSLMAALIFTALFTFFLTGFGPFVDQKETRQYLMTFEIKPGSASGMTESEVVLSFVNFPDYYIGHYSDELAAHLRKQADTRVIVLAEITSDYGKVRGTREVEIAGLRGWKSQDGYSGAKGSPERSPWD